MRVLKLWLSMLAVMGCLTVKSEVEITFTSSPDPPTIAEGDTAVFNCSSNHSAVIINWLINGTVSASTLTSLGVIVNGAATPVSSLIIPGLVDPFNDTEVRCVAVGFGAFGFGIGDFSPPSVILRVQDHASATPITTSSISSPTPVTPTNHASATPITTSSISSPTPVTPTSGESGGGTSRPTNTIIAAVVGGAVVLLCIVIIIIIIIIFICAVKCKVKNNRTSCDIKNDVSKVEDLKVIDTKIELPGIALNSSSVSSADIVNEDYNNHHVETSFQTHLAAPDSELATPDSELATPDSELATPDSELATHQYAETYMK